MTAANELPDATSDASPEGGAASSSGAPPAIAPRLLVDLETSPAPSRPREFLALPSGHTLLLADDGVHGEEVWVTDGTDAGTRLLLDSDPERALHTPQSMAEIRLWLARSGDGRGLIVRDPGVQPAGQARVLRVWSTDGVTVREVFDWTVPVEYTLAGPTMGDLPPAVGTSRTICLTTGTEPWLPGRLDCFDATTGAPQGHVANVSNVFALPDELLIGRVPSLDPYSEQVSRFDGSTLTDLPGRTISAAVATSLGAIAIVDDVLARYERAVGALLKSPAPLPELTPRSLWKVGDKVFTTFPTDVASPPDSKRRLFQTNGTFESNVQHDVREGQRDYFYRSLVELGAGVVAYGEYTLPNATTEYSLLRTVVENEAGTAPRMVGDLVTVGPSNARKVLFAGEREDDEGFELYVSNNGYTSTLLSDLFEGGSGVVSATLAPAGSNAAFECKMKTQAGVRVQDLCLSNGEVAPGTHMHRLRSVHTASSELRGGVLLGEHAFVTSSSTLYDLSLAGAEVAHWSTTQAPLEQTQRWSLSEPMKMGSDVVVLASAQGSHTPLRFIGGDLSQPPIAGPSLESSRVALIGISPRGPLISVRGIMKDAFVYLWEGETLTKVTDACGAGFLQIQTPQVVQVQGAQLLRSGPSLCLLDIGPGRAQIVPLVSPGTAGITQVDRFFVDGDTVLLQAGAELYRSSGQRDAVSSQRHIVDVPQGWQVGTNTSDEVSWHVLGDRVFRRLQTGATSPWGNLHPRDAGLYEMLGDRYERVVEGWVRWVERVEDRLIVAVDADWFGRQRIVAVDATGVHELAVGLGDSTSFGQPSVPLAARRVASRVLFVHDDFVHGRELWSTDGTVAGTHMIADAMVGPNGSYPSFLDVDGSRVLLHAADEAHGREPFLLEL